jgi:hypothetical protein
MAAIWLVAAFTSIKPPGRSTCLSSGASARLRDKPNGGQARFGIEESRPPLPLRMPCQKPLTRRSACFSTKAGRLDAPETSKCLASFMRSAMRDQPPSPIRDVARCGKDSDVSIIQACRTFAVLVCFSFAGQAETIQQRSRGRLAPVIAISSSRAAQGTYHRARRPQLST